MNLIMSNSTHLTLECHVGMYSETNGHKDKSAGIEIPHHVKNTQKKIDMACIRMKGCT